MKNSSIRLSLALVFSVILLGSCKKDSDKSVEPTKENLVGTYKVTKAIVIYAGVTTDYIATIEDCQKDDTYTLNADYSATYTDAGTKCDPDGGYETEWELDGDTVYIEGQGGKVKSFDGKTLVLEDSGTYNGMEYSTSFTFVKQ